MPYPTASFEKASRFQTITASATTDMMKNRRGSANRFMNALIKSMICVECDYSARRRRRTAHPL